MLENHLSICFTSIILRQLLKSHGMARNVESECDRYVLKD